MGPTSRGVVEGDGEGRRKGGKERGMERRDREGRGSRMGGHLSRLHRVTFTLATPLDVGG